MTRSSSSLLPNLHPVPLLSRTCIGLAPVLLSLLPFTSLLSCITFWHYTSQHWPQPRDTPQQRPFLRCTTSVCPNNSFTTHLAPQHHLHYPIPCSAPSQWLGIETLRTKLAIGRLLSQNIARRFCLCVCFVCVVSIGQASHSASSFGIILWVVVDMVVVVPVWLWCGVVCCSDVHISHSNFFFFTEVISACPQLITWHWLRSMLSHINMHLYSCHHQHQWQMATITTISNTNTRDEGRGWRCRWNNRGARDVSVSQALGKFFFSILFFLLY